MWINQHFNAFLRVLDRTFSIKLGIIESVKNALLYVVLLTHQEDCGFCQPTKGSKPCNIPYQLFALNNIPVDVKIPENCSHFAIEN
jgi:hypothetical protein